MGNVLRRRTIEMMMAITMIVIVLAYIIIGLLLYDRHTVLKEHRNGLIIRPYDENNKYDE